MEQTKQKQHNPLDDIDWEPLLHFDRKAYREQLQREKEERKRLREEKKKGKK